MSRIFQRLLNTTKPHYNACVLLGQRLNYSKEITSQELPATQDFLLQNLKNAANTNKVLELVSSHHKIMNKKHLMQALRSIFTLQKHGSTTLTTQEILRHPDFERICYHLKHQAGMIEVNDTIEALKVVTYMGTPSSSTIVQVLLQLLRHNVNDLSLAQIIFLDFLLNQHDRTPLIDALRLALPMVFEIQLNLKIDRDNLNQLVECFQYVSKKDVSENCVESVVKYLMQYKGEIDAKNAVSIIWSICDMKANEFFEPLLTKAVNTVILNVDALSFSEIETTLSKMLNKYIPSLSFYYNETLCDLVANYVVDNNLGFDSAVYLQRKLMRISHFNAHLTDYVTEQIIQNQNLALKGDPSKLSIVITSLALTDYKPKHWDLLKAHLEQTTIFNSNALRKIVWLKFAASFCVLGIYKPEVLQKALNQEFLQEKLTRGYKSDLKNFMAIYQAVRVFRPEFGGLLPSQEVVQQVCKKLEQWVEKEDDLGPLIEKGVGSERCVKRRLESKIGHYIDYAVLYRKGGFPVAFGTEYDNVQYIEDLKVADDHQLILIFALPPQYYTINCRRLKGRTSLMIRSLEVLGYNVVVFSLEEIEALSDFERIPYIMQMVKSKLSGDFLGSDSAL